MVYQLMTDTMTDRMQMKLSNKKISFWWLLNFIIWNYFWDIQKAVDIFMPSIMRCYECSIWKASFKLHWYFHRTQLKTIIFRKPTYIHLCQGLKKIIKNVCLMLLPTSMKILQILDMNLGFSDHVFSVCYFLWFFV